jgi:hypothetical protein
MSFLIKDITKNLSCKRWWIKKLAVLFVVWNLITILLNQFPVDSVLLTKIKAPLSNYYYWIQQRGHWEMFVQRAKGQYTWNIILEGFVTLENGKTVIIEYPRTSSMNALDKFIKGKARKFEEGLCNAANKNYWPGLAKYFAREAYKKTGVVPREVVIEEYVSLIESPFKKWVPYGVEFKREERLKKVLYKTPVSKGDIK